MKLEGFLNKIPVYSTLDCPPGSIYLINEDNMYFDYPKKKDGKPDMRYSLNKRSRLLGII